MCMACISKRPDLMYPSSFLYRKKTLNTAHGLVSRANINKPLLSWAPFGTILLFIFFSCTTPVPEDCLNIAPHHWLPINPFRLPCLFGQCLFCISYVALVSCCNFVQDAYHLLCPSSDQRISTYVYHLIYRT